MEELVPTAWSLWLC